MPSQDKSKASSQVGMAAKKVATNGLFVALALVFSYVEALVPLPVLVPGVKLGLANLVVLNLLYMIDVPSVFMILVVRILLAGFMFGNLQMTIYSLAGGILSFLIMLLAKKLKLFSMVGVSILGGVTHNLGQLIVAMLTVSSLHLMVLFPVLLLAGTIAGALIGLVGQRLKRLVNLA